MTTLPLDAIEIRDRSRANARNIEPLAASIREHSLVQPPVVRRDGDVYVLVAGQRRIAALRSLGWTETPVVVAESITDELAALYAEGDENTEREPFTVAEAVGHAKRIRSVVAAAAKQAQRAHGGTAPGRITSPKLAEVSEPKKSRETRTRVAKATGYGATTLDKAERIIDVATDATQPEPVRAIAKRAAANLHTPGVKVDREYKTVVAATQSADYIARYPDLAHYADRPADAIRLGASLDGYVEPELTRRLDTLRKAIAAEQRRAAGEPTAPEADVFAAAHAIFDAANLATRTIERHGAAGAIAAAGAVADQLTVSNWRNEFDALAAMCGSLSAACSQPLRRIK